MGAYGHTKNRHRMRCSNTRKCGQRFTLKKHPSKYVQPHKLRCPACGGPAYSDEQNRRNELERQGQCRCSAYPFPHRKGGLRMCHHHPQANVDATEEEWEAYQYVLATPRSDAR